MIVKEGDLPYYCYLSLGSNMGDRKGHLLKALDLINETIDHIDRVSSLYETSPWGFECGQNFLNLACELSTRKTAHELLQLTKKIEWTLGRMRKSSSGYQSRTIDIDLLLYGASIIISKDLRIPHPHIAERRFVLAPMAEIAAEVIHPITEKNFQYLLNKSDDPLGVLQLDEEIWIPAKRNEKQNTETKSSKIRKKKAGKK